MLLVPVLPYIGGFEDTFCGFGPEDTGGGRVESGFTCKRMPKSKCIEAYNWNLVHRWGCWLDRHLLVFSSHRTVQLQRRELSVDFTFEGNVPGLDRQKTAITQTYRSEVAMLLETDTWELNVMHGPP